MDNIPKDENPVNQDNSGEIFSSGKDSSYEEAIAPPKQDETPTQPYNEPPLSQQENYPPEPPYVPPSPFSNKKNLLIIGIVVFILVLLGLLLLKKLSSGPNNSTNGNVVLTYWGLWEDKNILQPILDEYKASHPNVTVEYIQQDQKLYRDRLKKAQEGNSPPDIFRFHNTWKPMFIDNLSAVPSNIYTLEEMEKVFFPVVKDDLKEKNNYYGIPLEIDGLLLFYNEDILKSANIAVPKTWEEVRDIVPKLTVKENNKIITSAIALGGTENIEHFSDILGLMFLQNGVQLNKSLFSCNDATSTSCAVDTLYFYRKFVESPNGNWDATLDNSIVAFASGKVAMIFAPSWQALTIKETAPGLNFKTAPVPQLPCSKQPCTSINWASYWVEGVSNKSKYQKEAWEFLKYLSSESTMKKLYANQTQARKLFGEPYSRVELAKTLADNVYLAALIQEAPTMKSFYLASRTFDGETGINSRMITYIQNAINDTSKGASAESALKTADNGFKETFKNFKINQ